MLKEDREIAEDHRETEKDLIAIQGDQKETGNDRSVMKGHREIKSDQKETGEDQKEMRIEEKARAVKGNKNTLDDSRRDQIKSQHKASKSTDAGIQTGAEDVDSYIFYTVQAQEN